MKDILGKAIHDFHLGEKKEPLWVHDTFGPRGRMPVSTYFRSIGRMPWLEQEALKRCRGTVLDIGAGAGSHCLELQHRGLDVTALDVSPLNCRTMRERGVRQIACNDIFRYEERQFDTLLLLMNGIGLCATLEGFRLFLSHAGQLLKPGGQILFDSSDVAYLYEAGTYYPDHYYGEISCRYEYKKEYTDWFQWLYIDYTSIHNIALSMGWQPYKILEDDRDQFLVSLHRG